MSELDLNQVKYWLANLPGGSLADKYSERWHLFDATRLPVVTVFGSYDTGKSSLIRRVLVDSGMPVPDWLTISSRHETFEVNEVQLAGCVLRDTPGMSVGADDIRGSANTDTALGAVAATDVVVITVTPQLATGERDVLRELLSAGWPPQDLWFVISRFDEAGIDPEDDLSGYRELVQRKTSELRESLGAADDYPVHVVSQDFSQFAGAATAVTPDIWDDTREWDGMAAFEREIESVGRRDFASVRASTEQRYWRLAVTHIAAELGAELDGLGPLAAQAEAAATRHDQWIEELEAVDRAAKASLPRLRSRFGDAVSSTISGVSSDSTELGARLESILGDWLDVHQQQLDRLLQNIGRTAERQARQPSWQRLEEIASAIADDAEVDSGAGVRAFAPHISALGGLLLKGLREFERSRPSGKYAQGASAVVKGVASSGNGWSYAKGVVVAGELLPVAIEIAEWFDEDRKSRATAQREAAVKSLIDRVGSDASGIARNTWEEMLAEARGQIDSIDASRPDLADGLQNSAEQLQAAIAGAERILS